MPTYPEIVNAMKHIRISFKISFIKCKSSASLMNLYDSLNTVSKLPIMDRLPLSAVDELEDIWKLDRAVSTAN